MAQKNAGGTTELSDHVAAALCYVVPFANIAFLLIEPYNRNRAVRFHAFQSLFFVLLVIAASVALSVFVSVVYAVLPFTWALLSLLQTLFGLAVLGVFLLLAFRAFQKEPLELPVLADYAHRYA